MRQHPQESSFVTEGKALGIHQDAYITRIRLAEGGSKTYTLHNTEHGIYVFVVSGSVSIAGEALTARDAAALENIDTCDIVSVTTAVLLIIEVPISTQGPL